MRIIFFISCLVLGLLACKENVKKSEPIIDAAKQHKEDSLNIQELMKAQEAAWNFGNLELFMKPYWNSDSLCFIGKKGLNKGWQNTLDNYKKSYPDKDAMGRLAFDNLEFELLDDQHAFVIGRWTLYRSQDTLGGHYSLIWKKINSKWVIIADHSS
jgi:hypothetical protein